MHASTSYSQYVVRNKPIVIGPIAVRDSRRFEYIMVPLKTISRRHALVVHKDGNFWIADCGSVNGTGVKGRRITAPQKLQHGDRIRVHQCELLLELAASRPPFDLPVEPRAVEPIAAHGMRPQSAPGDMPRPPDAAVLSLINTPPASGSVPAAPAVPVQDEPRTGGPFRGMLRHRSAP